MNPADQFGTQCLVDRPVTPDSRHIRQIGGANPYGKVALTAFGRTCMARMQGGFVLNRQFGWVEPILKA